MFGADPFVGVVTAEGAFVFGINAVNRIKDAGGKLKASGRRTRKSKAYMSGVMEGKRGFRDVAGVTATVAGKTLKEILGKMIAG